MLQTPGHSPVTWDGGGCLVHSGKQPGAALGIVVSKGLLALEGVSRKEMQAGVEPGWRQKETMLWASHGSIQSMPHPSSR